jgi:hypothetical protein
MDAFHAITPKYFLLEENVWQSEEDVRSKPCKLIL